MIAWVFPGQGSQKVGMASFFGPDAIEAQHTFEEASDLLGFDLFRLCLDGPEASLTATENAQPAILTFSIALLRESQTRLGDPPAFVAGHSLGEYSALVAARALEFAHAVQLVRQRGELMAQAADGTMAAVLGLELEPLLQICATVQAEYGVCVVANQNAPGQLVLSGTNEAVAQAGIQAKAAGARRVMPLNVSAAFHSPLMEQVAQELAASIKAVPMLPAQPAVVANVTAQPIQTPAAMRQELIDQITAPVRWIDTIHTLQHHGISKVIEIGPGSVLSGLTKRIAPELERQTLADD